MEPDREVCPLGYYSRKQYKNFYFFVLFEGKSIPVVFFVTSQVGFAEFNNTADNRANIGGTIIGAPIVGQ